MARTNPKVLSVRLTRADYDRIFEAARRNEQTLSEFSRVMFSNMEAGFNRAAEAVIGDILELLDLPRDTSAETLMGIVKDLLNDIAAQAPDASDATAEGAERPPEALSKLEIAACKARGLDPKVYAARKANAVRRVGGAPAATAPAPVRPAQLSKAEIAACRARGIDPKDFAARKRNAARRI